MPFVLIESVYSRVSTELQKLLGASLILMLDRAALLDTTVSQREKYNCHAVSIASLAAVVTLDVAGIFLQHCYHTSIAQKFTS